MPAGRSRCFLLILLLLAAAIPGAAVAVPPEPCSVEIDILDPYLEVTISSTQPGAATAEGTYTANLPPLPERAVISITAAIDTGWPVTVSPSTITISGNVGRHGTFHVTVLVPPGEPVQTAVVTVTGRMTTGGISCTPSTVNEPTVAVMPYIEGLTVTSSATTYAVTGPSDTEEVTVSLGSKANTDIEVELVYTAPPGIHVEGPARLDVRRSPNMTANESFTVRLRAPGAGAGTYGIAIEATAVADGIEPVSNSSELLLKVEDRPAPGMDSALTLLAISGAAAAAGVRASRYRKSA